MFVHDGDACQPLVTESFLVNLYSTRPLAFVSLVAAIVIDVLFKPIGP